MRETAKAIKTFASSFGLPAYMNDTIPNDVQLPYLTFPLVEPEWNEKASFYIQGWYKATGVAEMLEKADTIVREIGQGLIVSTDHGYVVIYPETPLIQTIVDENNGTRSFYINLSINSYHTPGV